MSYSRRQLYALGEPLGDSVTRAKGGRIIYGDGGGGGGKSTPEKTTQTIDLPEWAKPYAKDALERGRALSNTSYQAYTGDRIAGFSPLQEQAQKSAAGLDAGPEAFSKGVGQYMSPYVEQALNPQIREATRASQLATQQQQAGAVGRGAFGGSRDALMRMEGERNLGQQLGDIRGRGYQAAYDSAANQFRQGIGQQQGIIGMQSQLGGQQQALRQQGLTQAYQDFMAEKQAPYTQLGYYSDMIRGLPLGQQSSKSVYEAPGNTFGQVAGLGMGMYNMYNQFNPVKGAAEGGLMDSYAEGGVTSPDNVENIISKLSDQQLAAAREAAMGRRDTQQIQMIDAEFAERASLRGGLGNAFNQIPEQQQEEMMAGGGIIAFADGDMVSDPMGTGASEIYEAPVNPNSLSFIQRITNEPAWKAKAASEKTTAPTKSTAGAGRGSYQGYKAEADIKKPAPKVKEKSQRISPTMDKAITQMAEERGVPKEDFMDMFDKFRDKLQNESKEDLKGLQDLINKQSGKSKEVKEQALGKALSEFGFNLAAASTKRGRAGHGQGLAGLLGSAAEAAPSFTKSIEKSQELARSLDENDIKMQIEMRKYSIAARKNDSATAMSAAQNMRILQQQQETIKQQQRQLNETIRHNRAVEGLTGARVAASGNAYNTALLRTKSNLAVNAQKQAAKDWSDPLKGRELKAQYPSQKSYEKSLFNDMWSNAMPQLELIGTKSAED
jgi:hypothetical protein